MVNVRMVDVFLLHIYSQHFLDTPVITLSPRPGLRKISASCQLKKCFLHSTASGETHYTFQAAKRATRKLTQRGAEAQAWAVSRSQHAPSINALRAITEVEHNLKQVAVSFFDTTTNIRLNEILNM